MAPIERILLPTDFGPISECALTYAIDLAQRFGASIHLLHVIEEPNYGKVYPQGFYFEMPALRAGLIEDAEGFLRDLTARCSAAQIPSTSQVMFGRPERAIAEQALVRGSDLIVMGTHGRSGVAHLFVGSVAERVVRGAPCPVLTVRDTARVADLRAAVAQQALAPSSPTVAAG